MNRLLFTTLGGAASIIVLLVGSWASNVNAKQNAQDARITRLEQHYASIEQELEDVKIGIVDLDSDVKGQLGWQKQPPHKR